MLAAGADQLKRWLPRLADGNAQGEYYLTDIVAMAVADGVEVIARSPLTTDEIQGVNNRLQLAEVERSWQLRKAEQLLLGGATLADPARIDVRGELRTGRDVYIDVNCVFEGRGTLADGVRIGPNSVLREVDLGDDPVVGAHCGVHDSRHRQDRRHV